MHAYIRTYIHACIHTYIRTYIHTYILRSHFGSRFLIPVRSSSFLPAQVHYIGVIVRVRGTWISHLLSRPGAFPGSKLCPVTQLHRTSLTLSLSVAISRLQRQADRQKVEITPSGRYSPPLDRARRSSQTSAEIIQYSTPLHQS